MTVVYADVLILINFCMDFLSLYLTAKIMHFKIHKARFIISAAIGAVYALVEFIAPTLPFPTLAMNVFVAYIMCIVAYKRNLAKTLVALVIFYGISFLFGGGITAIYLMTGRETIVSSESGAIYADIPLWIVPILAGIIFLFVKYLPLITGRRRENETVEIKFTFFGRVFEGSALVDSGNLLTEPLSMLPVVIVSPELIGFACGAPIEIEKTFGKNIRLIPSSGVNGEKIIWGFKPDSFCIIEKNHAEFRDAVIGIGSEGDRYGNCDALLPACLRT